MFCIIEKIKHEGSTLMPFAIRCLSRS